MKRYPGVWELYDMEKDRTEMNDVAREHPDQVAKMSKAYDEWALRCDVIPRERILAYMKAMGQKE
ncbi:MAG: hypothetical protein HC888_17385 [Candidatus Competibacteraceae bacterium]|nr:hypothetical protein [Candidatus Competibacteraceae bacterium]